MTLRYKSHHTLTNNKDLAQENKSKAAKKLESFKEKNTEPKQEPTKQNPTLLPLHWIVVIMIAVCIAEAVYILGLE